MSERFSVSDEFSVNYNYDRVSFDHNQINDF